VVMVEELKKVPKRMVITYLRVEILTYEVRSSRGQNCIQHGVAPCQGSV